LPPRKIALVTGGKPAVIGNGAGANRSATTMRRCSPRRLVLDGLNVAAAAASADNVFIYAPARVISTVQHAFDERAKAKVDLPPLGDSEQEG